MEKKKFTLFVCASALFLTIYTAIFLNGMFTGRTQFPRTEIFEVLDEPLICETAAAEIPVPAQTTSPPKTTSPPDTIKPPETTEVQETTKTTETTKAPDTTEIPETTKAPETTKVPEATEIPETTKAPETTTTPKTPEAPEPEAPPKYRICEADGDVDVQLLAVADRVLSRLPEELISLFRKSGWRICVTDKNLSECFFDGLYESLAGTTSMKEKTIYLENREGAIKRAALHEFGHFVDIQYGYFCLFLRAPGGKSEEFLRIYEKESDAFLAATGYAHKTYNSIEFFGEGFKEYFVRPDLVRDICPELYQYIGRVIKEVSKM